MKLSITWRAASLSPSQDAAAASDGELACAGSNGNIEYWCHYYSRTCGHTHTPVFVKVVSFLKWIDRLWTRYCRCSPRDILNHTKCNSNDSLFFMHTYSMYGVYTAGLDILHRKENSPYSLRLFPPLCFPAAFFNGLSPHKREKWRTSFPVLKVTFLTTWEMLEEEIWWEYSHLVYQLCVCVHPQENPHRPALNDKQEEEGVLWRWTKRTKKK